MHYRLELFTIVGVIFCTLLPASIAESKGLKEEGENELSSLSIKVEKKKTEEGIRGLEQFANAPKKVTGKTQQSLSAQQSTELKEAQRLNQRVLRLLREGKYNEGIPLAQKALAIREKILGKEHPGTATSLNNLAAFYLYQKNYSKAEPLYLRSLAISEKILGKEHPDTATSLNN
ncbi:MAG: tetratricopeptide repeat protein [Mastigocoleus sp.]